jgi:hypothetical protein
LSHFLMTERYWLALILACYLLLGLGYSVAMPVWEAPDEMAHYLYALTITREGRLPALVDTYEARQPPGYYLLAASVLAVLETARPGSAEMVAPAANLDNITKPAPVFDWSDDNYNRMAIVGPLLLRWLGVAAGAVALLLIYGAARRLFPEWPAVALTSTALAAGTPQFLHITASVNNDVLAIVAGAFLFWLLAGMARPPDAPPFAASPNSSRRSLARLEPIRLALAAGAAVLLPFLVKLTVLPVGLALLLVVGWQAWRRWRGERPGRRPTLTVAAAALLALGAVTLFFLTTMPGRHLLDEMGWRLLYLRPGFWEPLAIFRRTAQTYWGYVGWVGVPLPQPLQRIVVALALAGALASLRALLLVPTRRQIGRQQPWLYLWLVVLLAVLIFLRNAFATPAFQGRFLFPVIGPLSLLAVGGWASLLSARTRSALLPIVLLLVFVLNLALWETGIRPVYYQPWLD